MTDKRYARYGIAIENDEELEDIDEGVIEDYIADAVGSEVDVLFDEGSDELIVMAVQNEPGKEYTEKIDAIDSDERNMLTDIFAVDRNDEEISDPFVEVEIIDDPTSVDAIDESGDTEYAPNESIACSIVGRHILDSEFPVCVRRDGDVITLHYIA